MLSWKKRAQIQHIFAEGGDISPKMHDKNSYQKYFKGKMRTNERIFKGHSLVPIGGGSLD